MAARRLILTALVMTAAVGTGCRALPWAPTKKPPLPAKQLPENTTAEAPAKSTTSKVVPAAYLQDEAERSSSDNALELLPPAFAPPAKPGESDPPALNEEVEVLTAGVTREEVEQIALGNNPTLRQASALVAQAQGAWVQAGLYPNPEIGYFGTEIGNEGQGGQQGGYITQTFVRGGKLAWSRTVAAREVDRARWELQTQQFRVLTDVRIQFYETLGMQQTVAVTEELRGIAQQGVRLSRQLEEALQAPRTDVLQSEVDLNSIEMLLETSRQREQAARRELAALLGVPELPPAPLAGTLEDDLLYLEWATACDRLWSANPLLQAAQARIAQARAQVQREQVEPIPDVNVQIGSQYDFATDDTVHSAQVQLPLPLYDRNQGNVAAASADLRRAINEAERIRLNLDRRLAVVWRRYENARTQSEIYRTGILPRAQETLRLTTQAYEAGQLDFLRVLTARRTYFENRLRYIEALTDLRKASVELEGFLLTGGLDAPEEGSAFSPDR